VEWQRLDVPRIVVLVVATGISILSRLASVGEFVLHKCFEDTTPSGIAAFIDEHDVAG
jgi:hypothetical protein